MTKKQWAIVQWCLEYTFIHEDDLGNAKISRGIVDRLVRAGVLDYHAPMNGDEAMWDLSNAAYKELGHDKFTRRQLVHKSTRKQLKSAVVSVPIFRECARCGKFDVLPSEWVDLCPMCLFWQDMKISE